jgi:hypothetical protein
MTRCVCRGAGESLCRVRVATIPKSSAGLPVDTPFTPQRGVADGDCCRAPQPRSNEERPFGNERVGHLQLSTGRKYLTRYQCEVTEIFDAVLGAFASLPDARSLADITPKK